jgi:tRNA-(ms[2]io[6]A)-hydroxylase
MLHLKCDTPQRWLAQVDADLPSILIDHAHCEKKAAGTAVQLLFRYPQHAELLAPLSKLAREELVHFEQLLALLAERGLRFSRHRPSPYAGRLRERERTGEPERLQDTLLCCALIEARSCERFGLLAEAAEDPALAGFYRRLLDAEARHHGIYLSLAHSLAPQAEVEARLRELAEHEAAVLAEARFSGHLHSGMH